MGGRVSLENLQSRFGPKIYSKIIESTIPCNGKWVESHLSELHCHVHLLQSHGLFAFGGGGPKGKKDKKDKEQRAGPGLVIRCHWCYSHSTGHKRKREGRPCKGKRAPENNPVIYATSTQSVCLQLGPTTYWAFVLWQMYC